MLLTGDNAHLKFGPPTFNSIPAADIIKRRADDIVDVPLEMAVRFSIASMSPKRVRMRITGDSTSYDEGIRQRSSTTKRQNVLAVSTGNETIVCRARA